MTIAEIVEAIKSMTILEVADLVKAIEDEFGVSAAPVAVAGGAAPAAAAAEEKTEFDVVLKEVGANKLAVRSPALALKRLRTWLSPRPRPLRKAFPRTRLRPLRLSWLRPAQLLS